MIRHQLAHGEIVHARVEEVYPTIAPGSVTLCHVDGPYGLSKAAWDKVHDLAAWYRPHIAEWGRLCAPSASVYLWNTAEGWAAIHPEMVAAGWTFTSLIVWVKPNSPAIKGTEMSRGWNDITEVCGFYMRESPGGRPGGAQVLVNEAAGADERNTIRVWLHSERARAGLTGDALEAAVNEAGGKGNMICRHSFTQSQWCLPTWEQWCALHAAWNRRGLPEGRPYLQRDRARVYDLTIQADHDALRAEYDALRAEYDALRAEYDALRAEYDALRAEYDALRAPFTLPVGVQNVWTEPLVGGVDRLLHDDGATLHPCQKPLLFARRIVEASSRPGDLVFEPFGGTCRIAAACEAIGRYEPEKARRYVCVEMDEDGRGYIPAVLAALRGEIPRGKGAEQGRLFGSPR